MNHPTDRITHTTAFVTPVVEHWLEREIGQWVHPMKDRSDDHPTDRITHTTAFCYTSRGALAGTRNSSMGPPHEGSIRRPSHRQDNTYHSVCCTRRGALARTRNSSMGPPHEGSIRRSSHRQDNTYHGVCYTGRGALAGARTSSMGPTCVKSDTFTKVRRVTVCLYL